MVSLPGTPEHTHCNEEQSVARRKRSNLGSPGLAVQLPKGYGATVN